MSRLRRGVRCTRLGCREVGNCRFKNQLSDRSSSSQPRLSLYTWIGDVGSPNMKILLVEDSRFLRRASEMALGRAGYEVVTAADGEEALKIAQDQIPNLILLDMMLPKLSGLEVLRALKLDVATKDIPVIVLTALSERNKEKLLQEGARGLHGEVRRTAGEGWRSLDSSSEASDWQSVKR
jgi:CheY-like chemotaxis protein